MRAEDPAWLPPGGENVAMVRERTSAALARIAKAHRNQTVLMVMHGTAINCLLSAVLGMDIGMIRTGMNPIGTVSASAVAANVNKAMRRVRDYVFTDDHHTAEVEARLRAILASRADVVD